MADRLDALGGLLDISSTPGTGTRVRGELPVQVRAAAAR
jgi:signal transduction histidine kinase